MNITREDVENVCVLRPDADHVDAGNVHEFRSKLTEAMGDADVVVFDMSRIQFLDSSGLGAFLSGMRKLIAKGGELHLCEVTPPVRTLFGLVRMNRILDIHETLEGAVKAAQG